MGLEMLLLEGNQLTGSLGPLRGCTALQELSFKDNQLVPSDEDMAHFKEQCMNTDWDESEEEGSDSGGSDW